MRPMTFPIAALAAISMLAACAPGPAREQPPVNVSTTSLANRSQCHGRGRHAARPRRDERGQ